MRRYQVRPYVLQVGFALTMNIVSLPICLSLSVDSCHTLSLTACLSLGLYHCLSITVSLNLSLTVSLPLTYLALFIPSPNPMPYLPLLYSPT